MGMRSTQRSESLHGVIEGLVSRKLSLTELFRVLDDIKEMQNIKQQRAAEKKIFYWLELQTILSRLLYKNCLCSSTFMLDKLFAHKLTKFRNFLCSKP
jgi:hypothetical protein